MAAFGFFEPQKGQSAEGIAKSRAMAAALLRSSSVPKNVGEGLSAIGDAIFYRSLVGNADASEKAGTDAFNSQFNSLIAPYTGGQASNVPMPTAAGEVASTSPAVDISGSRKSFIESLLPAAIEQGQRTGVDPRIIVAQAAQETGWGKSAPGNNYFGIKSHGQSGGNTLATTEYVNGSPVTEMASFRGYASPADSVRGYGDFITQNPRYKPLREAQGLDAQLAALGASGYATDPNYANSVGSIARSIALPNQQVASASPVTATDAIESVSPQGDAPQLPAPTTIAAAPAVAEAAPIAAPQQVAQNFQPQQIDPRLIEAANSPFATPGQKAILGGIIQQQQARNELILKQQIEQADPAKQVDLQLKQMQLQNLKNKTSEDTFTNVGDGYLFNNRTKEFIRAPQNVDIGGNLFQGNALDAQALNKLVANGSITQEQALNIAAGKVAPDPTTGALTFFPASALVGGGTQQSQEQPYIDLFGNGGNAPQQKAQQNGNGSVTLTGNRAPTEGQANAAGFSDRMINANNTIGNLESEGTDKEQAVRNSIPLIGNYLTSEGFQSYDRAKRDFINAQLRRESGAAIGRDEYASADKQYFPQPGDSAQVLKDKAQARALAIQAMTRSAGPSYSAPKQEVVSDDIRAAREAIKAGAPRDKVIERLQAAGIDTTGL